MTVGANSKFLTAPIYCVLNINIISVRVDFCPIVCPSELGTQIMANSKYWMWLIEACAPQDLFLLCFIVYLSEIERKTNFAWTYFRHRLIVCNFLGFRSQDEGYWWIWQNHKVFFIIWYCQSTSSIFWFLVSKRTTYDVAQNRGIGTNHAFKAVVGKVQSAGQLRLAKALNPARRRSFDMNIWPAIFIFWRSRSIK